MAPKDHQVSNPEEAAQALATPPTETNPVATNVRAAPRLAEGVELIGEFEDSGFKKAPFIARRADGQVVQMPLLLYRLAEQIDGHATYEQIAHAFSGAIERQVEAADVQMLIEEQLRPLGIVAQHPAGDGVELNKVDPLLALKFRAALIPDTAVRSVTTLFRPLFMAPVVLVAVVAMLGLDGWLFFVHGVSQSLRHTLYQPLLMLLLIGGVVLATAFHEIGHATACRYGGAKPGVMGVGIYIVWPAFYTDITDAYRLGKWARLRTDMGGMYFNVIFALIIGGLYALTGFEPLLLLVVLQNFAIIQQALPFLRLDGYYILSDLTGVPDIFLRMRSVLASFIPGRPADARVTELKSWVRIVVSAYVVLITLVLLLTVVAMVINLPRIVATGYDSALLHYQAVSPDFNQGKSVKGALDVVQALFLILPGAGLAYTAARVGRRTTAGAITWSAGHPGRQVILGITGSAALALAAFSWWPNGEYRPVQPGERGTLTGIVQQVAAIPTGRPSLTPERQRQLHGAPTKRQQSSTQQITPNTPPHDTTTTTDTTPTTTTDTTPSPPNTPAPPSQTQATPGTATTPTSTTPTSTTPTSTTPTSTTPAPAAVP